jgi:hypothetical protein
VTKIIEIESGRVWRGLETHAEAMRTAVRMDES